MAGLLAAADDAGSDLGPNPRAKILAAADYLAVAPQVVAVARDIDLGEPDMLLPRSPEDHGRVLALAEQWNLESSMARAVTALAR